MEDKYYNNCVAGDPVSTGFTLSRVWKRMKSKPHSHSGDDDHHNGVDHEGAAGEHPQTTQLVPSQQKTDAVPDKSSVV